MIEMAKFINRVCANGHVGEFEIREKGNAIRVNLNGYSIRVDFTGPSYKLSVWNGPKAFSPIFIEYILELGFASSNLTAEYFTDSLTKLVNTFGKVSKAIYIN